MKPRPDIEFAAFAGIDWADAKHDICLQAANSEEREFAGYWLQSQRPQKILDSARLSLGKEDVAVVD